ncbi:MAG: BatA domain-containing protein, partial [Bdellovibrionales bacterium]|nr:BatA domain-containing protein [Bdellovibrionales bacterium]
MPFQFASAAFLALGLAAPLLILAYTRKQTRDARKVSSIILLRKLPKHSIIRKKVKLPPNFWLELLALLALAAAAGYPLYEGSGSRTAIILDNTLSMSAKGSTKPTLFAEAVRKTLGWMDEQPSGNSYTLFTSSPTLRKIGESAVSSGTIESYLADLAPTLTSDSIASSIEQLGESGSFDQIVVVSDRDIREAESLREDALSSDSTTEVRSLTVGSAQSNLYLSSIGVETSGVRNEKRAIVSRIAQSGGERREVTVRLSGTSGGSSDYSLLDTTRLELNSDSSREVQIPVPDSAKSMRSFRVEIETGADDALAADNQAWTSVDAAAESAVLLVSPIEPGPDAFGLKNISGIKVIHATPAEYATLS